VLATYLQVRVSFLPVGHTHEDVDQMFSKISDEIKRNGSESIPGLVIILQLLHTIKLIITLLFVILFHIFICTCTHIQLIHNINIVVSTLHRFNKSNH